MTQAKNWIEVEVKTLQNYLSWGKWFMHTPMKYWSQKELKKKKKDTWLKIFEVRGKTSDCKNAKGQSWVVHYIKFHVKTNASTTVLRQRYN